MSENNLNAKAGDVNKLHNDPDVKEFLEAVKEFLKDEEGLRNAVDTGRSYILKTLIGEGLDFLESGIKKLKKRINEIEPNEPKDEDRTNTPEDDILELIDATAHFLKEIKEYKTDPINVLLPKRLPRFAWKRSTPEWEKKKQEIEKIESLLNNAKTKVKRLQAHKYSKTLLECLTENNIIDSETKKLLDEQFPKDLVDFDVAHLREKISYAEEPEGSKFKSHHNCNLEKIRIRMQQKVQSAYGLTEEQTKKLSLEKLFIMTDYKFIPKFIDSIEKLKSQEKSKQDGNSESLNRLSENTNKIVESYNPNLTLHRQSSLNEEKSKQHGNSESLNRLSENTNKIVQSYDPNLTLHPQSSLNEEKSKRSTFYLPFSKWPRIKSSRSKSTRKLSENEISQLAAEGNPQQETNDSNRTQSSRQSTKSVLSFFSNMSKIRFPSARTLSRSKRQKSRRG